MNPTSQSFRQEAEKTFPSTSKFHFPGMDQVPDSANQNTLEVSTSPCLGLVPKDQMAPKLKLILSNGNRYTFPYAYFLRVEYHTEGILSLFTNEKEIVISGRRLDYIEDRLFDNQIQWIREVKQALDVGQDHVFVKRIEIRDRE